MFLLFWTLDPTIVPYLAILLVSLFRASASSFGGLTRLTHVAATSFNTAARRTAFPSARQLETKALCVSASSCMWTDFISDNTAKTESQLYLAAVQQALKVMSFLLISAEVICVKVFMACLHRKKSYEYKAALKVIVSGSITSNDICSPKRVTSIHIPPLPQALIKALQKCKWNWPPWPRLFRSPKTCRAQFHCSAFSHALTAAEKLMKLFEIRENVMIFRTSNAFSHSAAFSQLLVKALKLIVSTWIPTTCSVRCNKLAERQSPCFS